MKEITNEASGNKRTLALSLLCCKVRADRSSKLSKIQLKEANRKIKIFPQQDVLNNKTVNLTPKKIHLIPLRTTASLSLLSTTIPEQGKAQATEGVS